MALLNNVIDRRQKKDKLLKTLKNLNFWQESKWNIGLIISLTLFIGGWVLGVVTGTLTTALILLVPSIATMFGEVLLNTVFYNDKYFIVKKDFIKKELVNLGYRVKDVIDSKGHTYTILDEHEIIPEQKKTGLDIQREKSQELKRTATKRAHAYVKDTYDADKTLDTIFDL